ncbi:unnamed protein product [Didymodactylos carnosus]|uniref:Tetratricopeptide repeat protein n=1 Tax=Didymodactylos carnosus TaxID=1234261 RepID=A0A8S2JMF3_9BILA|nr:unnamed protein product [Didymodactylos carnosus]CAF3814274.1 unnamed protein product [Didymodactylos carnosus]
MSTEEFETKLKRYVGGLISMNYFMLTSIDKKVALDFARARQKQLSESVLYRIELDSRIRSQQCPFADVEKRSYFEKEKEILISFGSVFRIRKVQRLSDGMWIVYLIFTGAEDQQLKVVTNQIRKEIQSSNEMIRLAKLMMQMGQFEKAEQFYNTLVSDVLLQKRYRCLSLIYNDLGLIFMQKKEHQKALAHFDMSLRILKKHVPKGDQSFATRYNNIGSVYNNLGMWQQALDNYKRALDINLSAGANPKKLAIRYNNIGRVLYQIGQCSEALKMFQKALDIELKYLPCHPSIAYTYSNIGLALDKERKYRESVKNLTKAIEISKKALPADHPWTKIRQRNLEMVQEKLKRGSTK